MLIMADPTPVVRAVTYERDLERCWSCGARSGLQYQHRAAVGAGGSKIRPKFPEGGTTCGGCNPRYEGDLQVRALACGWKIRRWVFEQGRAAEVPVFYAPELTWFQLTSDGRRVRTSDVAAANMMREVYGAEYDEWVEVTTF